MGQKLKMSKMCKKRLDDHIGIVVCKNSSQKYSRNESILKMAKIDQEAWAIARGKCSVWVKN